jgi:Spy/CpxP family protein refolding chaperone
MKDGVESLGKVRMQAFILLVLAFLAGAFAGGAVERVMHRRAPRMGMGGMRGPGGPGGPGPGRGMPGFLQTLALTEQQQKQADAIVQKRRARVDSLMQLIGAASDSTRHEIDALLTPEQKAKFDSLRTRGFGRGFGGGGRRGGGRDSAGPPRR